MSTKTGFRNARRKHFTQISNDLLNDFEVTLQAKGLLTLFLSNTEDWKIVMPNIIKRSKNGRDSHYGILDELIYHGYVARLVFKDKETNIYKEQIYVFSDDKIDVQEAINTYKESTDEDTTLEITYRVKKDKKKRKKQSKKENQSNPPFTENQDMDNKPFTENQDTENEDAENQYINNTKGQNTNLDNTNKEEEEINNNIRAREKSSDHNLSNKFEVNDISHRLQALGEHLLEKGYSKKQIKAIVSFLDNKGIKTFTIKEVETQLAYMNDGITNRLLEFHSVEGFAKYFGNGLQNLMIQNKIVKEHERTKLIQQEIEDQKSKERENIYYNWLED